MSTKLTPRQNQLYDAILNFIRKNRYPPTHRQLATTLGCAHHAVQELLSQVEKKGFVTHTPGISRSLRIIGKT